MSSNKRPFANPNFDSSDDEITNKKTKYDEEYVSEDETFDEDDLSTEDAEASEENFSDPDYVPDTDTEGEVVNDTSENDVISDDEKSNEDPKPTNNDKVKVEEVKVTSNLSFTSKLDELKAKGISLQRAGDETPTLSLSKSSTSTSTTVNANAANNNQPTDPKVLAFARKIINFPHDKRCLERCQLLTEEENLETMSSLSDSSVCSPDFIKSCVSIVGCSIRLGDITMARRAIAVVFKLGEIQGISPLSQALIGGVRSQTNNIEELERWEKKGLEAFRSKQFVHAASYIDKALKIATSCIRLKLAQGDAFSHSSKFVEGDKVASSILDLDKENVAATYLKGYCHYQKKELDKAINFFQQTVTNCAEHQRAKTFLRKSRQFKEKREAVQKLINKNKHEEAVNLLTQALEIDPRNKGVHTALLADRGASYRRLKRPELALRDCEEALLLDASSFEASAVKRSIGSTTGCTITEKAPTRAFSWLKAPTSAFTFN